VSAGQPLTVQFLAGGAPVANATVMAVSGGVAARSQTDAGGRATFTIDRPGPWLIKTIHMVRLPPGSLLLGNDARVAGRDRPGTLSHVDGHAPCPAHRQLTGTAIPALALVLKGNIAAHRRHVH